MLEVALAAKNNKSVALDAGEKGPPLAYRSCLGKQISEYNDGASEMPVACLAKVTVCR